jgi:hypothetical protein
MHAKAGVTQRERSLPLLVLRGRDLEAGRECRERACTAVTDLPTEMVGYAQGRRCPGGPIGLLGRSS